MGLEGLFRQRAFSVLVIEVDGSWGGVDHGSAVSRTDQLVWLAWQHRYVAFLKVILTYLRTQPLNLLNYVATYLLTYLRRLPEGATPRLALSRHYTCLCMLYRCMCL